MVFFVFVFWLSSSETSIVQMLNLLSLTSIFVIFSFFIFISFYLLSSFLSFMLLIVFSNVAIMPRAPSNFMFLSLSSWILPVCISSILLSWSLEFISVLHSDCPFLKSLQQNISSHLLLGKILLVGIYPFLLVKLRWIFSLLFLKVFLN